MKNLYIFKKIILFALIAIIICAIVLSFTSKKETKINNDVVIDPNTTEPKPIDMCYYNSNKTDSGFYDVAWIKIKIIGDKVTGEFRNLPAETDSKVGIFEGIVGPVDQKIMARTATVWWDSKAEGMLVKEELIFQFGDGSATVGFGEMINRGDGVYVYKNKENLSYIPQMSQIDCGYLDEKLFTEQYIRDNIATIATDKPVLGGTWYVTSVIVNASAHTGEVTYEDGHIQSKGNFIYNYTKSPQDIEITKFEVIKQ